MTRWLVAARQSGRAAAKRTTPTKTHSAEVLSVLSVLSGGSSTKVTATLDAATDESVTHYVPLSAPEPVRKMVDSDMFRHGRSVAGNPLTWTGRVVSLEEWRKLTEWQRHGPNGRLWCGIAQAWIDHKDDEP